MLWAMARSRAGSRIYAPLFELARGGMGRVDLVLRRADRFERVFAMKRLRGELLDETDARAMFLEEARLAGLLRHPNVVSVNDVGDDDEGPYLIMEYVESVSVAALIESAKGALLPVPLCVRIASDVAHGLHAAHVLEGPKGESLGLVHRDVSPPNILVGFDGVTRITDFGIARARDQSHKTATGWLKGKIRYMAPEQLRFEGIDHRTDLFALGIVFFELLSSQKLYASNDSAEAARRILTEPPPDIGNLRTDVEPEIVELLFELLAKGKDTRPSSAREVALRLERVLGAYGSDEGSFRVDEYLERTFATERRAMQERIARARDDLQSAERKKKRRPLFAIAGAIGAVAIAATVYAATPRSSAAERVTVTTTMPSTNRGAETSGSPNESASSVASAIPPVAASAQSEKPEMQAKAAKADRKLPRTRPTAPKRPQPASVGSAKTGGVPIWERYE